uniref:SERPIN domain-containing protein n=1 Tax=Strongyloides venezuelensis TaxID=75913 RepID=A0A0K0FJC5_STRVS
MPLSPTFSTFQANLAIQILNEFIKNDTTSSTIYSPISLAIALSMSYVGSSGLTKEQIKKYLSDECTDEEIHKNYNKFLINVQNDDNNSLKSFNKIYIKEGVKLLKLFTQTIEEYYQGQFEQIDFSSPDACGVINKFVKESTNNLIKDIIKPDDLDDATYMILINALYFKGEWVRKFDKNLILENEFHTTKDDIKVVDMMYSVDKYLFFEDKDYQLIKLNYKNNRQSMVILIPVEMCTLHKMLPSLKAEQLFHMIDSLESKKVHLYLPKFKIESTHEMVETFKKLGLILPFSERSDFSLITNEIPLRINKIVQKAFIEVDESGSEAAAATAESVVVFCDGGTQEKEYELKADHPFAYFIIDDMRNILFAGIFQ